MRTRIACILVLSVALTASYAPASTEEVKYTRFGAEAGGNATGEIPPFEGNKGLKCPDDYEKGDYLPKTRTGMTRFCSSLPRRTWTSTWIGCRPGRWPA